MEDFLADGIPFPRRGEASYPLSVKFRFTPGGGVCQAAGSDDTVPKYSLTTLTRPPSEVLNEAATADDRLRKYALLNGAPDNAPYYVPSLSVLSEAAFGRLTGIAPANVKEWADSMVLAYLEEEDSQKIKKPANEQEIWNHSANVNVVSPGA